MSRKISVIVPVYKVEPYLRKCVDSILNQTYANLEIILVDDGSPDNCGAICDEYARIDFRVNVIHKENGGQSDARNVGMRAMTGEYLMFVDSDDWLEPDTIQRLSSLLHGNNADLAIGGFQTEDDITGEIRFTNCSENPSIWCATQAEMMEKILNWFWNTSLWTTQKELAQVEQ